MKKNMIDVYNYSDATVGYVPHNSTISRKWQPAIKGLTVSIPISLEELRQNMSMLGIRRLFDERILVIKDNKVNEELGIDPLDEYVLDYTEVKELLETKGLDELEELLQYGADSQLEMVIRVCLDIKLADLNKLQLIEEYTGKDVKFARENMEVENNSDAIEKADGKKPARKKRTVE